MTVKILELPPKEIWLQLRKTSLGSSDAAAVIGANPWVSPSQLYKEKKSPEHNTFMNEHMKRGIMKEPEARSLFNERTNSKCEPCFATNDLYPNLHASVDGYDPDKGIAIEIKSVLGDLQGREIPDYHYAQLQHILCILELEYMYYVLYNGYDLNVITVDRDDSFCSNLIQKELEFFERLQTDNPPDEYADYQSIEDDEEFIYLEEAYMMARNHVQLAEMEEKRVRDLLIEKCQGKNSKGRFLTFQRTLRKGNIDYSKVPHLQNVDLEPYRKETTESWRITLKE